MLPGVPVDLKAVRPEFRAHETADLPTQLRLPRRALGHSVGAAAKALGVRRMTLTAWELGHAEPVDRLYPALVQYLGYEPWAKPVSVTGSGAIGGSVT